MDEDEILDADVVAPIDVGRIAEHESCLAKALTAYKLARNAYDCEPWAAAEKDLLGSLKMILMFRVPATKEGRFPDGAVANEISVQGEHEFHIRGRVYCLPDGTEPFAAVINIDPHDQRLVSYSLRFGNKSEPPEVKQERRIQKAPTDAANWDFEFHWP